MKLEALSNTPGTYALVLYCRGQNTIRVGKLDSFDFSAGFYVYVGSAFGPGGMRARLKRHLNQHKPLHWHIDYLRPHAEIMEMWISSDPAKQECRWAAILSAMEGAIIPVIGMGSSDCSCKSHLIYFPSRPSFPEFKKRAGTTLSRIVPE